MIPTKLAILIASFAVSTAAMASPAVPETGMKPSTMDSASCTKTDNADRNINRLKTQSQVNYALNVKQDPTAPKLAPVKTKK